MIHKGCFADADMMYRMYRKWGNPVIVEQFVAYFAADGMSKNCEDDFRNELVELLWRNRDLIEQGCLADEDFKMAMEAFLVNHCYQFRNWQQRHGKMIPDELGKLQSMCRKLARHAHSLYAKCALRWLAGRYLPVLIAGRECSSHLLRRARFWGHACYIPEQNKYRKHLWLPNKPLSSHPLLKKFFPAK